MRKTAQLHVLLVAMLLLLNGFLAIPFSFGLLSDEKHVPSFGVVEQGSVDIFTSFKEDWFYNVDRAVEVAEEFDVIITWCGDFVSDMHEANPSLIVLRYMSICWVYKDSLGWDEAVSGGWLLKDVNGEYVHNTVWTNLYLCDPNSQGYRDWLADQCKEEVDRYGFDGVFGDGASAPNRPIWDISGIPVNPSTSQVYADHEWSMALIGLDQTIKQKMGSKLLIGNGCLSGTINGWACLEDYKQILDALDGAMIETSIFAYWEDFRSEEDWIEDVDFIKWHTSQGKYTIVWSVVGEEEEEVESLTRYCFASYLLGIQDFLHSPLTVRGTMETSCAEDLVNVKLGTVLEDYHSRDDNPHVYERDFSSAKVLVNPTYGSYDVSLDGNYTTLDGQIVSQIMLGPHNGIILLATK